MCEVPALVGPKRRAECSFASQGYPVLKTLTNTYTVLCTSTRRTPLGFVDRFDGETEECMLSPSGSSSCGARASHFPEGRGSQATAARAEPLDIGESPPDLGVDGLMMRIGAHGASSSMLRSTRNGLSTSRFAKGRRASRATLSTIPRFARIFRLVRKPPSALFHREPLVCELALASKP
jgi:hypothetical protein